MAYSPIHSLLRHPISIKSVMHTAAFLTLVVLLLAISAQAGQNPATSDSSVAAAAETASVALPAGYPPAPVAPEVITRDMQGRATIRAVRLASPSEDRRQAG